MYNKGQIKININFKIVIKLMRQNMNYIIKQEW